MNRREYNRIVANICGKRGVHIEDIKNIKMNANLQEMITILAMLYKNPMTSKMLSFKPSTYESLLINKFPYVFTMNFQENIVHKEIAGELKFLTAQILMECNMVEAFLKTRNDFECAFMRGNYDDALNVINEFECSNGYSFWGVDCKMCAMSFKDVNQADILCDRIIDECKSGAKSGSVKTYVSINNYRFLRDITDVYFRTQVDTLFQEYDENDCSSRTFKEAFKNYIRISIDITTGFDYYDIRNLLIISNYVPVTDKYIILEKIIGWLSSEAVYQQNKLRSCWIECALMLREHLSDVFWENVCILAGKRKEIIIKKEKVVVNEALSLFCTGNKGASYVYCLEKLKETSNSFSLINMLAKSGECSRGPVPYLELAWLIRKLYVKDGKDNQFVGIVKQCNIYERIFSFFSFGNYLGVIIENETKPIMPRGKASYINALLSSDFIPSKLAFFLSVEDRQAFIKEYKEKIGQLFLSDWQIAAYFEADRDFLTNFICDDTSRILNKIKNEEKIVDYTKYISEDGFNRICESFMLKKQFDLAMDENKLCDAINIYVKAFFISQWMVIKIDCNKVNSKITRQGKKYLENNLSYCIYAFATRYELSKGEGISETVVNSCRNILKNNGDSIVDLVIPEEELEKKKWIYFLRNICTYDGLRRARVGVSLAQDLYSERLQIIEKILPYYKEMEEKEDMVALEAEKELISAKIQYLDIAKCINQGKINTSWIVFSDEAEEAMISIYNMYDAMIRNHTLSAYVNAFAIVKKDYVQEVNRILSITIRHGILENELLRFLKKRNISIDMQNMSDYNKHFVDVFYKKTYALIETLLNEYIVCTYKKCDDKKLSIYIDEAILAESFQRLPKQINAPEEIRDIFKNILNDELEHKLPSWGKAICDYIETEMREYLNELSKNCEGILKVEVNKACDLLSEEISKLREWFGVTGNQSVPYRLVTLGDALQREAECVEVNLSIDKDIIVTGNVINFLYTVIRELVWNGEKHSGYKEDDSKLYIKINISMENENIVFEVINNIEEHIMLGEIDQSIEEVNHIMNSVEKADTTILNRKDIQEGKSGYKKIAKLLKRAYDGAYKIRLWRNEREFIVKLSLLSEALN